MEVEDQRRALVCDFLMKMYLEQCTAFRHYEVQRSTAATILTSICAALIGLTGVVSSRNGGLDAGDLPLTVSIILVALLGLILMIKLFERSRVRHSLSKAYLETLNEVLLPDVNILLAGKVSKLKYVANAYKDYVLNDAAVRPFDVVFPQGKRVDASLDAAEFSRRIETHSAVYPQKIVYPVHNASMPFEVKYISNRWLWPSIFVLFSAIGLYLSVDALC